MSSNPTISTNTAGDGVCRPLLYWWRWCQMRTRSRSDRVRIRRRAARNALLIANSRSEFETGAINALFTRLPNAPVCSRERAVANHERSELSHYLRHSKRRRKAPFAMAETVSDANSVVERSYPYRLHYNANSRISQRLLYYPIILFVHSRSGYSGMITN